MIGNSFPKLLFLKLVESETFIPRSVIFVRFRSVHTGLNTVFTENFDTCKWRNSFEDNCLNPQVELISHQELS